MPGLVNVIATIRQLADVIASAGETAKNAASSVEEFHRAKASEDDSSSVDRWGASSGGPKALSAAIQAARK